MKKYSILILTLLAMYCTAQKSAFKHLADTADKPMAKGLKEYYQIKYAAEDLIINEKH